MGLIVVSRDLGFIEPKKKLPPEGDRTLKGRRKRKKEKEEGKGRRKRKRKGREKEERKESDKE